MTLLKSIVAGILAWAARRVLSAEQPLIVGVTGSAGKTSTKEAIGHVLIKTVHDREIRVAPGSLNSEFGLPLVLLGLQKPEGNAAWARTGIQALGRGLFPTAPKRPIAYVLEYGVQAVGDMRALLAIAAPNIAVVTNVGVVHFGSLAVTAREKGQLVRALPASGIAVLNADDTNVAKFSDLTNAEIVSVRGSAREFAARAAVAVAEHGFGVKRKDAEQAIRDWQPPVGRLNILPGIKGSILLDDSFNANPQSVTLALSELQRLGKEKKSSRLVAVLGDMLELGPEENRAHAGVALLAERVADHVVLVGPRFRRTKKGNVWFPGPLQAAEYVQSFAAKGDMILVKGSQGMRMEKVSELVLADPKSASRVLVRQTPFWKKKPYVAP